MAATLSSAGTSRRPVHYTIAELDALELPDNGVRYELVHGQLLVSPFPSAWHQVIAGRLFVELSGYIETAGAGMAFTPGAVMFGEDSELQPDVLVAPGPVTPSLRWRDFRAWWLVVEVLSPSTRNKDLAVKREAYLEFGVREIWFVDPIADTVTIVRHRVADVVLKTPDRLRWLAPGAPSTAEIDLAEVFARR